MNIHLPAVRIIHPRSDLNGAVKQLLVEDGIVRRIGQPEDRWGLAADVVLEGENLHLSPGWLDLRVSARDPGHEHQEDLYSVREAAAAGGFTEIAVLPNTHPVVQTKEAVAYLRSRGAEHPVRVHPVAAVSVDAKGKDLTEMIDLHRAGAVAFSDGVQPVWHPDLFVKTLQYLQTFNGLLINRPEEKLMTQYGNMHEGLTATMLGLKGIPALAEELMVARDLRLLAYAGGKLHFSCLSTAGAVQLVREAKAQGLAVTCDMAAHQVAFDDTALLDFDTHLKVNPPFRSRADIDAIWAGLADGTIDAVVSDHSPLDEESKKLEFDLAEFGIIGLETAFAVLHTHNPSLSLEQLVGKFAVGPRDVLGLPLPELKEGTPANLTVFDPRAEWQFTAADIRSKSRNTPFVGARFTGRVMGVIHQGQASLRRNGGSRQFR
jgi:dihydroorotase